ncbi:MULTISPECIES: acyl-CoA desaturase [unclassified Pseudactinotalea]|uniref:fatty acid desaturase family protein n=1 Tax=unclassified Pseudactinotalea TaxID=2649176 RepID=UPI00128C0876|nr:MULTISPECIES: acyl-CoA desaturase [unclassified Pseudactinotalea]MPV50227.1 acyl-CoA desaturase [Pseudactinotalea sp. HY160]QGH70180.1 acyl-CoA desaturase [Pseudactinotalea sp. HY158]
MSISTAAVRPGERQRNFVRDFTELRKKVTAQGLMRRRYTFYWSAFGGLLLAYGAIATAFVLLGDSWWQLLVAGALAVTLTQTAFLGHDAAHMQIFRSGRKNEWASLLLANVLVGLSYGWWQVKHSKHHAQPNKVGADPDIDMDVIAFVPGQTDGASPLQRFWYKRQGYLFFPLVCLEGINLHYQSIRGLFRKDQAGRAERRWLEFALLVLRIGGLVAAVFLVLSPGLAFAFLGVQLAVFGFYMGCSFAPNHKGMPIVPKDMSIDFLRRQVLMSRNIRGGWFMAALYGGLNYQIEHHLFPSMPRIAMREVAPIVKAYCLEKGVKYTETSMGESYRILVEYLNKVGLGERDPFDCPLASQLRLSA